MTNFSLTVLHEIASLIHCADLCSRNDYCMEFVYSETSRHCIGLHCLKTDNYAYQYVSPTPYRGLYFGKGKILFMIIYFKPFTLISNNLIMVSLISSFYSEQLGSIFRSPLLLSITSVWKKTLHGQKPRYLNLSNKINFNVELVNRCIFIPFAL